MIPPSTAEQERAAINRTHPTGAEMAEAQAIVDSLPVITCYASCEWDELHDDGKLWIAAIIRQARAHLTKADPQ